MFGPGMGPGFGPGGPGPGTGKGQGRGQSMDLSPGSDAMAGFEADLMPELAFNME